MIGLEWLWEVNEQLVIEEVEQNETERNYAFFSSVPLLPDGQQGVLKYLIIINRMGFISSFLRSLSALYFFFLIFFPLRGCCHEVMIFVLISWIAFLSCNSKKLYKLRLTVFFISFVYLLRPFLEIPLILFYFLFFLFFCVC